MDIVHSGGRPAGRFAEWLVAMRAVLRGEAEAEVPCGDCVGCCTSAYPIPLRPTDRVALERVPAEHLHLAMGAGGTRAVMGYRADGSCPMMVAGRCTIYADRPRTCRDYDCRIYAAAGLHPDGDRPVIRARVDEWSFAFGSKAEEAEAAALRRAARFIRAHADAFPAAMRAGSATAAAVLAVKTCELFRDEGQDVPVAERVARVIAAARAFDAQ